MASRVSSMSLSTSSTDISRLISSSISLPSLSRSKTSRSMAANSIAFTCIATMLYAQVVPQTPHTCLSEFLAEGGIKSLSKHLSVHTPFPRWSPADFRPSPAAPPGISSSSGTTMLSACCPPPAPFSHIASHDQCCFLAIRVPRMKRLV